MWPFTRSKAADVPYRLQDFMWLGNEARANALAAEVDQVLASGSHLLVTSHHKPTLEPACALLTDSPRALELVESPTTPAALAQLFHQFAAPTCVVVGAEHLTTGPAAATGLRARLKVIVLGRHPLRNYDDAVVAYALRVSPAAELVFSISLDDPLMKAFAGERQRAVLQRMGMTENDSITHPWLTKSIQRAQAKIKQQIERQGEVRVEGFGTLTREHLPPTLRR